MVDSLLTGVIQANDPPVFFSARKDTFEFCFMTDSVYEYGGDNRSTWLSTTDGFLHGKTHNNHSIAIYVGSPKFEVIGSRRLQTPAYIEAFTSLNHEPLTSFQAIQFIGGTLNQVFCPNAIKFHRENGNLFVSANDDSKEYVVHIHDTEMKMTICSSTSEHYGDDGCALINRNVQLTLEFVEQQPMNTLFEHYNRMIELLSFLTFRENVGFDSIVLLAPHPEYNVLSKTADVYIRNDGEKTAKAYLTNITFEDLDESIPSLVELFYDVGYQGKAPSFGFFRTNDNDNTMTNEKIRVICSALERELNYVSDIKVDEKVELSELETAARETVKRFQKEHSLLSNDTYISILSGIGYWSFPLAEKLCALYKKYFREMDTLNQSRITIDESSIRSFVKYRNDITHGRHRILDIQVATTAFCLCGLVYCCVLSRVGLNRRKVLDLCSVKILS